MTNTMIYLCVAILCAISFVLGHKLSSFLWARTFLYYCHYKTDKQEFKQHADEGIFRGIEERDKILCQYLERDGYLKKKFLWPPMVNGEDA